jgi:hypothetical protein
LPKINRRDPNEENFLILRQLASKNSQKRRDFEEPKRKFKGVKDELEGGDNRFKFIPHSSLILRLEKLVESCAIIEQNSGEKSKKGLIIKEYKLTFFGFIKLLQLCKKNKFYSDIFKNSSKNIPIIISFQIKKLLESKIFTEPQLFFILVDIANNIDIQIDFKAKENAGIIGDRIYQMPSLLLIKEIKWVHVYDIEIKIKQIENEYILHKTFIASGKTRSKKDMEQNDLEPHQEINKIFMFAFVNELIMRCYRTHEKYLGYMTPDELPFLLEMLRSNDILKKNYFKNIDHVLEQQRIEQNIMLGAKKSLKSKRSLISRKKLK